MRIRLLFICFSRKIADLQGLLQKLFINYPAAVGYEINSRGQDLACILGQVHKVHPHPQCHLCKYKQHI